MTYSDTVEKFERMRWGDRESPLTSMQVLVKERRRNPNADWRELLLSTKGDFVYGFQRIK